MRTAVNIPNIPRGEAMIHYTLTLFFVVFASESQTYIPGISPRPPLIVLDGGITYTKDTTVIAETIEIMGYENINIRNGATVTFVADTMIIHYPKFFDGTGKEGRHGKSGISESSDQLYSYYDGCSQTCNIMHQPLPISEQVLKTGENGNNGHSGGAGATIIFKYKKMEGYKVAATTRGGEGGFGGAGGSGRLICCAGCGVCKIIPPGIRGKKGSTGLTGKEIRIPLK